MWQSLREHRAGIPERLAHWRQAEIASQNSNAQVEQHELLSCDIKLDLSVALSYETDIILEHQGERNIPQQYLKEAHWDAHNNSDGTIDLGYFAQDQNRNYIAVDFDFNTFTWGTTHKKRNRKYRLTILAPIKLGLQIVDKERVLRSDWGEIDGTKDQNDTPDEQSNEEEQIDSPHTPAPGNTDEEAELQKIAEAIPTPTNLQPGNLFAPSIFTLSAFMATTTQTTSQVQPPPAGPSTSSAGKTTTGGSGPPGGGGGQGLPNPLVNPFGPPGGGNPGGGGGNPGGGGGNPSGAGGGGETQPSLMTNSLATTHNLRG